MVFCMTSTATHGAVDPAIHRHLAVELFNDLWRLLEKPDRSPAEELEMIHAAHASRHHWGIAGDARNWCIGEWQIARVYATLGRAEPARFHAAEALRLAEAHGLDDFVTACAHEALARAAMAAGNAAAFDEHVAAAERAGAGIDDDEDRQVWRADMGALKRPLPST